MATKYSIHMEPKFRPLEVVDVDKVAAAAGEKWWNQTLVQVNDHLVRLGVFEGEFHWHKHDREDEFFLVLGGHFLIDLEGRTVELGPHQGLMVPKGVLHKTRSPERSVVIMVETATVTPTGD